MDTQSGYMCNALAETKKASDAAVISAGVARSALEISQRAAVVVDNVSFEKQIIHPGSAAQWIDRVLQNSPIIVFKNVGNTEAIDFHFRATVAISGRDAGQAIPLSSQLSSPIIKSVPVVSHPTILQRGGKVVETMPTLAELLQDVDTDQITESLQNGNWITILGFIRYRDTFNRGWYVAYSSVLGGPDFRFRTNMQLWEDGKQPPLPY